MFSVERLVWLPTAIFGQPGKLMVIFRSGRFLTLTAMFSIKKLVLICLLQFSAVSDGQNVVE